VKGRFYLQVAASGARPFGAAAYLRRREVEFRVFGSSISRWRTQTPAGVFLKFGGLAFDLADRTAVALQNICCDGEGCWVRGHACGGYFTQQAILGRQASRMPRVFCRFSLGDSLPPQRLRA
jgi:hypothetical protein